MDLFLLDPELRMHLLSANGETNKWLDISYSFLDKAPVITFFYHISWQGTCNYNFPFLQCVVGQKDEFLSPRVILKFSESLNWSQVSLPWDEFPVQGGLWLF